MSGVSVCWSFLWGDSLWVILSSLFFILYHSSFFLYWHFKFLPCFLTKTKLLDTLCLFCICFFCMALACYSSAGLGSLQVFWNPPKVQILSLDMNVSVNCCFFIYVSPVTHWWLVQGVPCLSLGGSWERLQPSHDPNKGKAIDNGQRSDVWLLCWWPSKSDCTCPCVAVECR